MFEFLHSELDIIKCNEDFHLEHDYCRLVETEKPTNGIHRNIEIKKFEIPGINIIISDINNIGLNFVPQKFINYLKSPNNNIYIQNSSLLI